MKRLFILLCLTPMLLNAGVILKTSGERIDDITIKEVNETEVIYKTENGIETSILKNDVSAILYDDGRYEEIKHNTSHQTQDNVDYIVEYNNNEAATNATKKTGKNKSTLAEVKPEPEPIVIDYSQYQDGLIHKLANNSYYYIDSIYSKKAINSLVLSCPEAKAYYDNGHKWMVAGWSSAGASVALLIMGSVMMGVGNESHGNITMLTEVWAAGVPFMLLGILGVPACTTIACIGHKRMNNAYKVFNTSCATAQQPALSLKMGANSNGIGLTLNF